MKSALAQPAARMGKHRVDLAGVRRQVGLRHDVVAVVAGDVLQQLLEIVAVAVDRGAEVRVALVLAADLVEGLLALQRVEAAREDVALAAPVAVPQLDRGVVVDGACDVDRQRVQRFDDVQRRALLAAGRTGRRLPPEPRLLPLRARRRAAGRAPSRPAATGRCPDAPERPPQGARGRSRPRNAWLGRGRAPLRSAWGGGAGRRAARARARPGPGRLRAAPHGWNRDRKRRTCGRIWRRSRTAPSAR